MPESRICVRCQAEFYCMPSSKQKNCSKSCGAKASKNRRHGMAGTRLHATWLDMRNRCRNPKYYNYAIYGGRGIKVCERWNDFANFAADMGDRPSPAHSIDRIDNNGDYEPSNCRWATKKEQHHNRRPRSEWRQPACSSTEGNRG